MQTFCPNQPREFAYTQISYQQESPRIINSWHDSCKANLLPREQRYNLIRLYRINICTRGQKVDIIERKERRNSASLSLGYLSKNRMTLPASFAARRTAPGSSLSFFFQLARYATWLSNSPSRSTPICEHTNADPISAINSS